MSLQSLPLEVLQHICSYLGHKDLRVVSTTSKECQSAANVHLLCRIDIKALGREELQSDVGRWRSILERTVGFAYVNQVFITAYMPCEEDHIREVDTAAPEVRKGFFALDSNKVPLMNIDEENDSWAPLAQLIHQLPALSDVHFHCANQFPRTLLDTLHHKVPLCKLPISKFHLRSLYEPYMDPREVALIKSPCLNGVQASCRRFDSQDRVDYNQDALYRIASGLAPNLRIVKSYLADWDANRSALNSPRLIIWEAHIDFSKLEILSLRCYEEYSNIAEWLRSMQNYALDSLRTLRMYVTERSPDEQYYQSFDSFIRSLKPLTCLMIRANLRPNALEAIVERHGPSLRVLSFDHFPVDHVPDTGRPQIELHHVQLLQKHCPLLADLTLRIPRSKGDAQEVMFYKTLGSFPRLQVLRLTLDSPSYAFVLKNNNNSSLLLSDVSFDEFDRQPFSMQGQVIMDGLCNGHVRDSFINRAMDEKLARSILEIISTGKRNPQFPIKHLELKNRTPYFSHLARDRLLQLGHVEEHIGESWSFHSGSGDNKHENFVAKQGYHSSIIRPPVLDPGLDAVFRKTWPRRDNDTGHWQQDWHSFPLFTT
ncbi:uncharacterized protein LY89DRAFT_716979 [Mollisia scopiformis]|uniref:F-box domain-containing protein n=1 Tax=Mollisia scopiformis TaxID=149040 RepID=A0A194XH81_MOLSC|nr:uncharacterized protein LY89DRAFT_716979 [Mollisia scopiformis]KUJ19484.1 hypothetical protein LY89DRAFT_716979 [Mollisia scopiformis]